jgi:hypothetical protein
VFQQWKLRMLMHFEDAGGVAPRDGDPVAPPAPRGQLDECVRARHILMQALGNDLSMTGHVLTHKTAALPPGRPC